jgi:chromosome segregation ATPase
MMVAGIALALIAASFLPKSFERKEDGSVTIASLEVKLKEANENIDHLESSVKGTEEQLIAVQEDKARTAHQLENTSQQLAKADEELAQNKKKFDEIATVMETMKDELASADQLQELAFKHRELELKCTEYEAMIADLTQRLKDAEKKSGKAAQK